MGILRKFIYYAMNKDESHEKIGSYPGLTLYIRILHNN
jgi:hypothetical protein